MPDPDDPARLMEKLKESIKESIRPNVPQKPMSRQVRRAMETAMAKHGEPENRELDDDRRHFTENPRATRAAAGTTRSGTRFRTRRGTSGSSTRPIPPPGTFIQTGPWSSW